MWFCALVCIVFSSPYFFFNDTAPTEIYTSLFVGSVSVYKRQDGGWALGCRIDGGQAEFVRVPYADQGLNRIQGSVPD